MAEKKKKHGVKNPNEGTDGKLASNMTGEAIQPNYDYGNITDNDKKVVKEIIDLLNVRGQVPCSMFAEELKTRFQIEEIPMKPLDQSLWHQFTKNERIGTSIQGFRETKNEQGKKIRIPHIGFSADLDYLDEMIQRIAKQVREIPEEK